jgi:flavin-dependent dehydrogenase
MKEYPVIIAGGGPAGAACAKALKEEGIESLVIEKEKLPRHKICSGVLFGQTQVLLEKYFGAMPPDDVYCEPKEINASDIQEWGKGKGFFEYVWEIPKDGVEFTKEYKNIWRNKFDSWLLKQAGVKVRENCMLKKYSVDGDRITVEVFNKEKSQIDKFDKEYQQEQFSCSYLIGADGGNSQVRKLLDPEWINTEPEVVIFQAYYRFEDMGGLKDGSWNVFFKKEVGDILCCVHRKGDFLALCVGGFKGRNLNDSMEIFKKFLSDEFKVVFKEQERVEGCMLRLAPPSLGKGNVLLTGEAAGMMYLNGEGISTAIDSGYRAGKAVAQAIKENKKAEEIYPGSLKDILDHMNICMKKIHFLTA